MKCTTKGCLDNLVPVSVDRTGLGGSAHIQLSCDGCTSHNLIFNTSTSVQDSRRYVASLSIALAFLLTGHVHTGYHRTLGQGLGIPSHHRNTVYTVVKDAYANIQRMLQEICERAKAEMKEMPAEELGNWPNAVTTADGCWLTGGIEGSTAPRRQQRSCLPGGFGLWIAPAPAAATRSPVDRPWPLAAAGPRGVVILAGGCGKPFRAAGSVGPCAGLHPLLCADRAVY